MKKIRDLYLDNRLFVCIGIVVVAFITSFIVPVLLWPAKVLFLILVASILGDFLLLFRSRKGLTGYRSAPEKLSNGDDNPLTIYLENFYVFPVSVTVIDEIPHQFQRRDIAFHLQLDPGSSQTFTYQLRPVKRGEYSFGTINAFVRSPVGLLKRRFRFSGDKMVPVYPSFMQMHKYELMAISNRLTMVGIKKVRKIGQNAEFELVRDYVSGDDIRTINWKATARRNQPMVNQFQDERSQQVYCLIDKGRVMKMPFREMSLLDYAINTSLVISNIAIKKYDKAGLLTFQDNIGTYLPASSRNGQMNTILEVLYNQKTGFRESDFSTVFGFVRSKINQRSLLLLFTNFESRYGMRRQLPYLIKLAKQHLLVVIFFENTELSHLATEPAQRTDEIYYKAVAEDFMLDKKLIVKELQRHGIQSILTAPENLTVNTINKYIELKARSMI